jgi:thioredoxin-like negative regulator of GroEL
MKVLKFYAEWCAPCKGLTMIINGAKDKINIPIEEVNIDDNVFMATEYKIRSVPTLVIVDDQENEIKRHTGILNEEKLLEFLEV